MRLLVSLLAVACCAASACAGRTTAPAADSTTTRPSGVVEPTRIDRARAGLPAGYETADITGRAVPVAFWGFGVDWLAEPQQCGALADPSPHPGSARGWSASGSGGIIYAVAAASPAPDAALIDQCGRWTLTSGRTTGAVVLVDAPVTDATTIGMSTAVTTVVEGGIETRSKATTFAAYIDEFVVSVTVVADPGVPTATLGADFAAALLVRTVAALRG